MACCHAFARVQAENQVHQYQIALQHMCLLKSITPTYLKVSMQLHAGLIRAAMWALYTALQNGLMQLSLHADMHTCGCN